MFSLRDNPLAVSAVALMSTKFGSLIGRNLRTILCVYSLPDQEDHKCALGGNWVNQDEIKNRKNIKLNQLLMTAGMLL